MQATLTLAALFVASTTEIVDAIRIILSARETSGRWHESPSGGHAHVASFRWPPWEEPRWRARVRPVFHAMRQVFTDLDARGRLP